MKTLTDKRFNELLKQYGSKTMETFNINEIFKYTQRQWRKIRNGKNNNR